MSALDVVRDQLVTEGLRARSLYDDIIENVIPPLQADRETKLGTLREMVSQNIQAFEEDDIGVRIVRTNSVFSKVIELMEVNNSILEQFHRAHQMASSALEGLALAAKFDSALSTNKSK